MIREDQCSLKSVFRKKEKKFPLSCESIPGATIKVLKIRVIRLCEENESKIRK